MTDQAPAFYQEAFSSRWRDATPWLWRLAAAFLVAALVVYYVAYFSDALAKGASDTIASFLGILAILTGALAMNGSVKRRGEVVVTKNGLTVAEEGSEWFFAKEDVQSVSIEALYRGKYRDDLFVLAKPPANVLGGTFLFGPPTGAEVVQARPYHFSSSRRIVQGVVIRTTNKRMLRRPADSSVRPLFIPTKDPQGLMAAIRKMKV